MPSHPIATWITPCNSRNVLVLGTSTRRHTIGLIPSSQTLTCTISAASASAADEAVSKTGLVRFGARVTRPAYRRPPFPRRGHPRHPDALPNAGVTQVFNVNDVETATWVSRTLGATTEAYETTSQSFSYGKDAPILGTRSDASASHLVRRDLLTPDEVMRLPAGAMLLLRQGAPPILAGKVYYFADPEFRGLFVSVARENGFEKLLIAPVCGAP